MGLLLPLLVVFEVGAEPISESSQANGDKEIDREAGGPRIVGGEETGKSLFI